MKETTIHLQDETFRLQDFELQLVATLDYNRILVQDVVDGGFEMWQAAMDGTLLIGGVRYHFVGDLEADPILN